MTLDERMEAAAEELRHILVEWQAARAPFLKPNNPTTEKDWTRLSKAEQALAVWVASRHPMKPTEAKE